MLNITKGKINRAQKVVIYGPEGIGKSSLAARFPDPVIIDTEGGTAHMDVRRIDKPQSWEELLSIVKEVAATPGICKTLVIDTADWAEQLITTYLCNKYKQNSIESFGYGLPADYTGHGIGRSVHEDPYVPNVGKAGTMEVLKKGMCIAVEPMVFMGSAKCYTLPDGWGVKSYDHSWAAHYEHTVAVTDDGYRIGIIEIISQFLGN